MTNTRGQKPVKGTKPWEHYFVFLKMPENADTIEVGYYLAGKGKIWIDAVYYPDGRETQRAGIVPDIGNPYPYRFCGKQG